LLFTHIFCIEFPDAERRQLEAEANEKLSDVYQKLMQAGVDKTESERDAKLKETLSNLQRVFPGPHLCRVITAFA
jgi:vacuolar-type H+-ATPase subunit H